MTTDFATADTSSNTACTFNPPIPSTAATLLISIREAQADINKLEAIIADNKAQLQELYDEGLIVDTLTHDGITAKLTQRKTWQYTPAVKQLQEIEQLEGLATQKVSSSWTVRSTNTTSNVAD